MAEAEAEAHDVLNAPPEDVLEAEKKAEEEEDDEDLDNDIIEGKQARPYHNWGIDKAVGFYGKSWCAVYKVLKCADFVGNIFANFLGLTDSKYQYVIDAYERHQRELQREREEEAAALASEEAQAKAERALHGPVEV